MEVKPIQQAAEYKFSALIKHPEIRVFGDTKGRGSTYFHETEGQHTITFTIEFMRSNLAESREIFESLYHQVAENVPTAAPAEATEEAPRIGGQPAEEVEG